MGESDNDIDFRRAELNRLLDRALYVSEIDTNQFEFIYKSIWVYICRINELGKKEMIEYNMQTLPKFTLPEESDNFSCNSTGSHREDIERQEETSVLDLVLKVSLLTSSLRNHCRFCPKNQCPVVLCL